MDENADGFLRPSIDASLCIRCGACTGICRRLGHIADRNPEKETIR